MQMVKRKAKKNKMRFSVSNQWKFKRVSYILDIVIDVSDFDIKIALFNVPIIAIYITREYFTIALVGFMFIFDFEDDK